MRRVHMELGAEPLPVLTSLLLVAPTSRFRAHAVYVHGFLAILPAQQERRIAHQGGVKNIHVDRDIAVVSTDPAASADVPASASEHEDLSQISELADRCMRKVHR
ncbi:hypothetical protein F5Y05DRAFT_417213 [Hypoxylon sp. FL0543]|nr:hypothetical protein F5Y05DRAFT_417213 [Hypoxylon sp. FL0543]